METFPIVPAQGKLLWILTGLIQVLLLIPMVLIVATAWGSRNSTFEISAAGLRLRGDLYSRMIPAADIRTAEVRTVDLLATSELEPRTRTMGTAVPGYRSGWFRLRNGEKALLYLSDNRHAVYVPTTRGYSVLLSPQRPEQFVERLRAIGGRR